MIRAVVTDIAADGMLAGPGVAIAEAIARASGMKVIVSGGVSTTADIQSISKRTDADIEGLIIGRALYEGQIDLPQTIKTFIHG